MSSNPAGTLQFFRRGRRWRVWNNNCIFSGMQPRTRSTQFVRSLVDAATVRPMLSALLAMKRARVNTGVEMAAPTQPQPAEAPRKAA